MIFIKKGTKTPLPKQYYFVNNICAHIYDQITEILSDKYYSEMLGTTIQGNDEELKKLLDDNSIHPLDALKVIKKNEELEIVLTKHIVMSLISDMVNFIYESIIIAQKGKMSVAYTLLRKPFLDQLLILEQILVDRKDFIDRFFHNGNPQEYDPSSNKLDKKEIIKKSILKLNSFVFQPEVIYELRYDKISRRGINWITNHAIHIVTNDKNYKTENQNLNFIFSINEDIEGYWDHFYYTVPMLLIYTTAVIDKIVFEFITNKKGIMELKHLERFLAMMMLLDDPKNSTSKSMYQLLSKMMVTKCNICNYINRFSRTDFNHYFFNHYFLCKNCNNQLNLSELSIDYLNSTFEKFHDTTL